MSTRLLSFALLAFFAVASLRLLTACGKTEPFTSAVGSYSDVAILTDLESLGAVADQLASSLDIQIEYSLRPESLFNVAIFDMKDRRQAWVYKNVLLIGLLEGDDPASRELRRQLGGQTVRSAGEKNLFIAARDDVWARNQVAFFIAGPERNLLQSALRRSRGSIVRDIQSKNRERMREFLFSAGHDVTLETRIRSELGFGLQVPTSYRETRIFHGSEEGAVEIAKTRPTRAVAVMYREGLAADVLEDRGGLLELRRDWGGRFLSERLQDDAGFTWSQEPFGERTLLTLAGFWETEDGTQGGPFRTFFLRDEQRDRLYGINILCYAPGMAKHSYMREAQAVAETLDP